MIAVHSKQCTAFFQTGNIFNGACTERQREGERSHFNGLVARLRWKIQSARRWKLEWTDSMHFDDKPLQQNSRGEYIAFVERAGRCPNGLRYFSAGSNKFDRRASRENRTRAWTSLCLRNYTTLSGREWSWSVVRLIDCCNARTRGCNQNTDA